MLDDLQLSDESEQSEFEEENLPTYSQDQGRHTDFPSYVYVGFVGMANFELHYSFSRDEQCEATCRGTSRQILSAV